MSVILYIDFNSVLVQVVARENEDLILRVLNGGQVDEIRQLLSNARLFYLL